MNWRITLEKRRKKKLSQIWWVEVVTVMERFKKSMMDIREYYLLSQK